MNGQYRSIPFFKPPHQALNLRRFPTRFAAFKCEKQTGHPLADKPSTQERQERLAFTVRRSAFGVRRSAFGVHRRSQDIGNTLGQDIGNGALHLRSEQVSKPSRFARPLRGKATVRPTRAAAPR